ncbi:MAG: YapH protein [Acidobacteriaceae bacterium]|nr:YapH protein [Acidobacteriaceae bacterium]
MGGETVANLIVRHQTRFSELGRTKYTLGMLGTNDINGLVAAATIEANLVTLWKQLTLRGTKPYYGTIVPQNSSTDYWLTLANQSANSYEPQRVLVNKWMRDGAPISSTTGLPVAVGSAIATTNRCVFYVGGVAQVNPTSGVAAPSGPGTHPAAGLFELANSVETAQDSGLWKVDAGNRTVTDANITAGLKILTSATAAFTAGDVGHYVSVAGAGASGAYLAGGNTIISVQSATQATLNVAASTTVTNAVATIDGQPTTNTINSGDGRHPGVNGHYLMGVEAAKMVAVWQ